MKFPIYMDNHSTTPVDPRVLEAMLPCLQGDYGNAASRSHPLGWSAEKRVEKAREQVAALIGAEPKEIIFTSGATESNNMALKGVAEVFGRGAHLITQATEHKSVLDPCHFLQKKGAKVTTLAVDPMGRIDLMELEKEITDETVLISVMFANNEIGTVQPIREIGKIVKARRVLFHVDAAQAIGKIPIDVRELGIDLLSFSGHKFYAPKGIGALYVRSKNPRVRLATQMHGGGQESGMRSGTLNVPSIVAIGKACELAAAEMAEETPRVSRLRDRLYDGLARSIEGIALNGHPTERLPNNLNISIAATEAESLLAAIGDEIAISSSSACASGSPEPSHVLKALKLGGDRAQTAVRFGLGRFTTEREVDYVIQRVTLAVEKLRRMSGMHPVSKPERKPGASHA